MTRLSSWLTLSPTQHRSTTGALLAVVSLTMLSAQPVRADDAHHKTAPTSASTAVDLTEGEVRKVDSGAGKLTLEHGVIKNLDRPATTTVFAVKDKALLEKLKLGDKLRFKAVLDAGSLVATEIRLVP